MKEFEGSKFEYIDTGYDTISVYSNEYVEWLEARFKGQEMKMRFVNITENGKPVDLTGVEVKFYCGEKDITPKDLLVEGDTISWNSDEENQTTGKTSNI